MDREKVNWYPDELLFLKENINKLTNQQLLDAINAKRSKPVGYSAMRHQFIRMGILRQIQIRWSQEDVNYLKKHFRKKGNVELAILLTKRKKTFRVIDGKRVYRQFNKKHVEKKLKLLKLKRTPEEVSAIKKRNIEIGLTPVITSSDNYWSRGVRQKSKDGDIKIWKRQDGKLIRVIKVDGKFTPYSRWFYHNFISPVPAGMNVFHIDLDPLNDDPENLELRNKKGVNREDRKRALQLLNVRLEKQFQNLAATTTREEQKTAQKELARLKKLIKQIELKLNYAQNNSTQHNRYYTGEVSECLLT